MRNILIVRRVLWGLVAVAALIMTFVIYQNSTPQEKTSQEVRQSAIDPVFTLVNHNGETVNEEAYRDKWLLVFFGFTHCPDICPTTLSEISQVMENLGPDADKVQPLFVTVDPERDTPEVMKEYVSKFHPSIIGLTGDEAQIRDAADNFRIFYNRRENKDAPDGYFMNHSSILYFIDPEGRFVEPFRYEEKPGTISKEIRQYMENKS